MSYYPKPFDNFDGYSVDDGTLNKSQSETGINNPCFENGPDPPPDTNKKLPPPNKIIAPLNKHKSQQLHEISVINNDILSSNCSDPKKKDPQLWRDLVAYWILGLCNNYGFIVMLSAANDMLEGFYETDQIGIDKTTTNDSTTVKLNTERSCTLASTGTILLADIIPGLIIKLIAPFLPFWINVRVFFAVAMSAGGFLFVGLAKNEFMAIFGVILTSASSCLGETTFLAYSSKYNKNVVSTWSSGTGGAGITGSLSYAALKSLNIDQTTTMLIMLVIPALECFTFWILLRPPASNVLPQTIDETDQQNNRIDTTTTRQCNDDELNDDEKPLVGFVEKLLYCGPLLKYMIPLMAVYIAQYFINQGLFQLVYFENTFLDQASQYRWLTVDFQLGVFISKSTVNLYSVDRIWLMSLFQFINVLYFLIEVVFYITPSIWITFVIVLWEGLLGGSVYSHTFFKISKEITALRKRFAMGIGALGVSAGIAIAGFAAIPAHNAICALSLSTRRFYWW